MSNQVTIMCAACGKDLYSCFQLSSGQPCVFPVSPEVPYFREGFQECCFCGQPMFLELSGQVRAMIRDDGYVRVA